MVVVLVRYFVPGGALVVGRMKLALEPSIRGNKQG